MLIESCRLAAILQRSIPMIADKILACPAVAQFGEAAPSAREDVDYSLIVNKKMYSSRIIKAGALLADTTTLFDNWDESQSVRENLERLQRENIFGKASRSRIRDVLAIFRQRYLHDESVTKALACLVKNRLPRLALDRILFFHAAQADALLHDIVTHVLADSYSRGITEIRTEAIQAALTAWVRESKTSARWSEDTTRRVAQGLLATLRDFGILQGANTKRLAPAYIPIAAFSYIAFYLHCQRASGERLIHNKEWLLFFLTTEDVERMFMEAHQQGLLEYYAAGTVIRIAFPSESLEDYARVISERAI